MSRDASNLNLVRQRYRVMKDEDIIGHFSNKELAAETAHQRRAIVFDVSVKPPKVVYKDGTWLEKEKQIRNIRSPSEMPRTEYKSAEAILAGAKSTGGSNAMADGLTKRGPADRKTINLNNPPEVTWWCRKLCCTEEKLKEAVGTVGTSSIEVNQYLNVPKDGKTILPVR